ncbi:serine/threonine-protein kinase [Nonomuraea pusilla]|uniref:non-specific serine/threonine protein kinase n=1 Tax=Nonomuraea pusilla TaxID=46177 RepID=A0A1H8GEJ5_9ACTN|nr:serine/threonine-protein kinase [Nonomuraea pusilla]SEN42210.1 Serine/threonine protein kinase [Nonomuraea pusilla]
MTPLAGRYRLLSQLGQGGMGTVWRAMDELLRQEVAVKEVRFPPGLDEASRAEFAERTLREARAAATLRSHPSIVTVHDVVLDGGRPWIVMELVRGRSLDRVVRDDGPLPPDRVAAIGLRVLDALGAAHAAGILHRDVKPANVLLTDDGRVLLTDFGIATIAGDPNLTRTGLLSGSPGYIAPERLRGEADGPLGDLWALGATLFTAVEGGPPFARQNEAAVLAAVLMQEPAPFRRAGPLAPVLAAVLEKDPARRCSAEEAAVRLEAVAKGDAATEPGWRRRRGTQRGGPGRRRQIVAGAAVALVLAVVAGVALVPYFFPNAVRLLGYVLTPRSTHTAAPAPTTRPPSPTPRITGRVEACDLLTGPQARSLFHSSVRRQFIIAQSCQWQGADYSTLNLFVTVGMSGGTAEQYYDLLVEQMKDEPKRRPGTKLRTGPDVGDEAFSHTGPVGYLGLYETKIIYRLSNVTVSLTVRAKRPGYTMADRAAKLVETALVARRTTG